MPYAYDDQNIFAKILRGDIPSTPVYESAHTIAFPDISPQKKHHLLVIPKGPYRCYDHFVQAASDAEQLDFFRAVGAVAKQLGVSEVHGGNGYRLITNSGPDSLQEVPHFHVHLLGGEPCGPLTAG
ncbi:HIT domain-containing protein [Celeribacter marinus]|uniref:Bis(5'-nucleosyl)-tetraphosphatase(Asymmetrical) n=1 Tax=Celeribacter marinus TaxID=1397108 RepID=A0A0N9ZF92_9RHOB|nr:HIT domain-containing protein [Celeribacter marinus]ALI55126.1 bis(5'-nucleosyl)-tetraphosphatase(asymmetrical) [Celeribacter marinus]SFK07591.1 histidine triad (HIT) family protein [Celeribacter marinus]